ncbi:hypothetical protein EV426DRAFT_337543 [Tirmania nivea]|nr:hypothetical protein EV426DRAFT_337543 [Tirmania nivea]
MAHINEGSIASDTEHNDFTLYPIVEDSSIYPHQYSQTQFNTSTGEIFYDSRSTASELDYTTMLSAEEPTIDQLHPAPSNQNSKIIPPNFYSLSDSSAAAYQPQGFCLPANVDSYGFHSPFNIPRTIGNIFTTSAAEDPTLTASIDDNSRFLIQTPTFPIGISLGSHTASEYRSTPGTSPATSIAGFEGASSIKSALGSLDSSKSSTRGSPYSIHEDLDSWNEGVPDAVENPEQGQGYWFIDPQQLTNTPPQHLSEEPASSVASPHLSPTSPHLSSDPPSPTISRKKTTGRLSPFTPGRIQPSFPYHPSRRDSIKSTSSSRGSKSPRIDISDDSLRMHSPSSPTAQQLPAGRDAVCPECSRTFRDMRAHLLTHKLERPEKCPIATCEYSKKGFARKYDCQRHTLTHYKGTMVCGFCPCAGSPAEKSFNRADVFKRHLMSVHSVEQTAPNGRKKTNTSSTSQAQRSPSSGRPTDRFGDFQGTGKCSTCSGTFSTAQQFYEHLDDCVYSKVVQEEPAAAYNEMNLSQIKLDDIRDSLVSPWKGRRSKSSESEEKPEDEDDDENEELGDAEDDAEDKDEKDETWTLGRGASKQLLKPNGLGRTPSTRSKSAVSKTTIKRGVRYRVSKITARDGSKPCARRGGKKRKNFPAGWGCTAEQMVTKRRCLMVYDGPNILCKDEMMMNTEWEVRASIGGDNFVSDLDFWTMQRANAALDAGLNVEVR